MLSTNKILGLLLLATIAIDYFNLFNFSIAGLDLTKIVMIIVAIYLLLR